MTIQLNEVATQITATERKSKLATASWARAGVIFYAPDGNVFQIPKGYDVLGEVQQQAAQKNLVNSALADEYVGNFEKDAAFKLREKNGWKFQGRQPRGDNAVPEWDHFCLSVTGSDVADFDKIKEVFVKELQSANVLSRLRSNDQGDGKPVETQLGIEGKRPIFISEEHDNTGARHVHFFVGRLAFDHDKKEISKAIVIGNAGIKASIREGIQAGLIEAGLDASRFTFAGTVGSQGTDAVAAQQLTTTLLESEAEEEAQGPLEAPTPQPVEGSELDDQVAPTQEAAAKAPAPEVPTTLPAGALLAKLERARGDKHEKVERLSKEYLRKLNEAKEEAQELKMMDLAIAAVRQEEAMKSQLSTAQGALAKANTDLEALDAVQKTAAGVFLEKSMALDLTDEQRGALRSEDAATRNGELVNVIQSTVTFSVGWKEALEVIGELGHTEVQEKLLEDPSTALEEVVEAASRVPALDEKVHAQEQALAASNAQLKALSDAVQSLASNVALDDELRATLAQDPLKGLAALGTRLEDNKRKLDQAVVVAQANDSIPEATRDRIAQDPARGVVILSQEFTHMRGQHEGAMNAERERYAKLELECEALKKDVKRLEKTKELLIDFLKTPSEDAYKATSQELTDEERVVLLDKYMTVNANLAEANEKLSEATQEIEKLKEKGIVLDKEKGPYLAYKNGERDSVTQIVETYSATVAAVDHGKEIGIIKANWNPSTPGQLANSSLERITKKNEEIQVYAAKNEIKPEEALAMRSRSEKAQSDVAKAIIEHVGTDPEKLKILAANADKLPGLIDSVREAQDEHTRLSPASGTPGQAQGTGFGVGQSGPKIPGIDDDEGLTRGR